MLPSEKAKVIGDQKYKDTVKQIEKCITQKLTRGKYDNKVGKPLHTSTISLAFIKREGKCHSSLTDSKICSKNNREKEGKRNTLNSCISKGEHIHMHCQGSVKSLRRL